MSGTRGTDGTLRHIAVVGASHTGIAAAETLRRQGFDGRLTLVDAGRDIPPGLDAEPLPNTTAEGLDLTSRTGRSGRTGRTGGSVRLSGGGRDLDFDGLIITTGAEARRPAGLRSGHPAVFALRTSEDSLDSLDAEDSVALRAALSGSPRVAVVGAGFTGCEIASYCRTRGLDVTVVESAAAPLQRVLGKAMGRELADLHRDHGTVMTTGTPAVSLRPDGVVTADGALVPADVVVIAAGRAPRTAWLRGSGLDIGDGVLLDATCAAVAAVAPVATVGVWRPSVRVPRVVAAGSVARWYNPLFGEVMRVEHRADALAQAVAAADTLLADGECAMPFESVPYFRLEQYGTEIQFAGLATGVPHLLAGALAERRFVAVYTDGQHVTGALCVNAPSQFERYRRMVAARSPTDVVFAPPTMFKSAV
ncbi:NAD(P)/FAD-dependent oxidoreductase [Streptomyces sp. NPDC050433]|uniref:NAD(P)/FAD-dependent oxidoreductase n=1 Tax=unclassified Streptomyces TaxID=2593676 RepID=UPI00342BA708